MLSFTVCRSKDEELNLVSVEEFYSEAPPEISREVSENAPVFVFLPLKLSLGFVWFVYSK